MTKFGLFFLGIFMGGLFAAFAYGPVWALYLYELVYFFNPGNRWWGNNLPSISYSFYVTLTLLCLTIIHWKKHQNSVREIPEFKWIVLLVFSYLFVSFFAVNEFMHQRFLGFLATSWVVLFIACFILDSFKKVEWAIFFYVLGSAYIGYEAFNIGRNVFGRIEGIGTVDSPEANTIAATIVPSLVFCAYFLWHGNNKYKITALICAALIANALVLINSRGAFLGAIGAVLYFGFHMLFAKYKLPKQRMFLFLFIVVGVVGTIRVTDATFWERMATLQTQSSIDSEGSGGRRMNFWLATFDMLDDYPLGTGIYGYETLSAQYLPEELVGSEYGNQARAVHSIWFQALAEIGWFGFAVFVFLIVSLKIHLRKAKQLLVKVNLLKEYYFLITIEASFLGFLIASSFINMSRTTSLYLLLGIGISAAVVSVRMAKAKSTDSQKEIEKKPFRHSYSDLNINRLNRGNPKQPMNGKSI